ncbi:hypothetical protein BGZ80_000266 [Entomortierella chlamydospora]|uniref:Uncharacterized protein n=1 Tax=Entomortierella chlamydospora TaxID=101097 RepID=A0A9P6T469_9FUNG|nr:hypothetical protein BGZ80_000266 [Entomortierella chlamydospora]
MVATLFPEDPLMIDATLMMIDVFVDVIGGGSCFISDDSEPVEFNQLIPASQDLALKFQALDGITGNILVKESESNTDTNIRIHTLMRASSSKLLDQLEQSLFLDSKTSARVSVHINDRNDKETKRRLTHENCARADVEIIYPRGRPGTGKLHLSAVNGQFNIMMGNFTSITSSSSSGSSSSSSSAGALTIFEELRMGLMNGEVNLGGVTVSTKLLVEVTNGHILGHINSAGTVVAQIINGPVDLAIDSEPKRNDWDANNLHVTINTVNGRIGLNLLRRFLGHFAMSTTLGNPATIRHLNPTTDNIKYISRSSSATKGWISKDSEEPGTSSRLDLGTVNGNILVEVDTFKK